MLCKVYCVRPFFLALITICTATTAIVGCKRSRQSVASPDTVGIPQTEIKDQNKNGFCWAYTFNGMLESWALAHKKATLTLSPEYTGFYRLAQQLQDMANSKSVEEIESCVSNCQLKQGSQLSAGIELINKYGAIPESIWTGKSAWQDLYTIEQTQNNLFVRLGKFKKQKGNGSISLQNIIDNVMVGEGVFPPLPKFPFTYEGKLWTPQSFAKEKIGFDSAKYKELLYTKPADYDKLVSAIKRALARGIAVPLGFHNLQGKGQYTIDPFEAKQVPPEIKNLDSSGGHIVLITDFVNQGDDLGAMSVSAIKKSLAKKPSELSYLVVKNSWGLGNRSSIPEVAQGYNIVDQNYLRATLAYGYATVAVPEDIYNNPEATETNIAPSVADNRLSLTGASSLSGNLFLSNKLVSREYLIIKVVQDIQKFSSLNISLPRDANLSFKDIENDRLSAPYIAWVKNNSLLTMEPLSSGRFGVELPLTRKETKDFLLAVNSFIKKRLVNLSNNCENNSVDNALDNEVAKQNTKLTRAMIDAFLVKWSACRVDSR